MSNKIHIKNMVCPRCIDTVKDIFDQLNIQYSAIALGEATVTVSISNESREALSEKLMDRGFELLESNTSKLINEIKAVVIEHIHHSNKSLKVNFSTFIAEKLNSEYTSLSKLFSAVEGITIERYILRQKVEKVKELLFYNEMTLSEIAFELDYSSVAHLSAQFKKETGMTTTAFKKLRKPGHIPLDSF